MVFSVPFRRAEVSRLFSRVICYIIVFGILGHAAGYLLCIRTLGGLLELGRILMVDFRAHNPAGVGSIPAAPTEFLWV